MMSIRLVAEKRSPFAMSEISERKLFARRANSAAGRACMPNLFRIVISRVTVTGSRFWRHLISVGSISGETSLDRNVTRYFIAEVFSKGRSRTHLGPRSNADG